MINYRQAYERLREAAEAVLSGQARDVDVAGDRYVIDATLRKLRKVVDAPLPELQPTPCPDDRCPDLQAHKIEAVLRERLDANHRGKHIDVGDLRLIADVVQYEMGGHVP